jgi:PTS system nitrogen regulatory IIA component
MQLRDFLDPTSVNLDLKSAGKEAVLDEMVALLRLDERATTQLGRLLKRRELLGSTGVGRGIAVPHCRSLAVSRLRLAFGVHRSGIEYDAIDRKPVHILFLIVAPPTEVSNQYLPVLGKIAQFAQMPDVADQLTHLASPDQLFNLLEQKRV